jgi:hypothetical protein
MSSQENLDFIHCQVIFVHYQYVTYVKILSQKLLYLLKKSQINSS